MTPIGELAARKQGWEIIDFCNGTYRIVNTKTNEATVINWEHKNKEKTPPHTKLKELGFDEQDREEITNKLFEMQETLNEEPSSLIDQLDNGFRDGKFYPKYIGDSILSHTPIKTLKGSGVMYRYTDGFYIEDGKELIKKMCAWLMKDRYKINYCSETISYIQAITYTNPVEVDNEWVNLENGLLNPVTREFKGHDPKIFSTIRIPITYDPLATCPLWIEKLTKKTDTPTRNVVQEMFGYCYLPKQKYEVAFMVYGAMRTMKSTTLYILEQMLGKKNVESHSLQSLTENPFGMAYLYGKSANICADLPSKYLKEVGAFMTLTGGDGISVAKKHQHPIHFFPSAKLIFSCNNIPSTTNKNNAFYRRWILLEFNIPHTELELDPNLKPKLVEELPGILNWALDGLERLLKQNKFSYWLSVDDVKDLYERNSNSIQSFIYQCVDTDIDEGVLKKREAYAKYKKYCAENDLQLDNQIKFGKMFIALTGCGTCKQDKIPAYQGVSWKIAKEDRANSLADY